MPPSARKTALFIEAEKHRVAESFDLAIPVYQAVLKEDPSDVEVRKTLAGLYLVQGDRAAGLKEYMTLVMQFVQGGELDKAEQLLRRVRNIDKEGKHRNAIDALLQRVDNLRGAAAPVAETMPVEDAGDDEPILMDDDDAVESEPMEGEPVLLEEALEPEEATAVVAAIETVPSDLDVPEIDDAADLTDEDVAAAEAELAREARDTRVSSATLANALFTALPPEVLNQLIRACEKVAFRGGVTIFEEGSSSRALFIVGHGVVDVLAAGPTGKQVRLAKLGPGDVFGEMAFLTGSKREATVVADSDCLCYRLSQGDAARLMSTHPEFKRVVLDLYKARVVPLFLAKSEMFGDMPPSDHEELAVAFEYLPVKEGVVVVEEGSHGDDIFFVKSGEVRVVTKGPRGPLELDRMGKHEMFGEISFLTGAPRTASVTATANTELLRLDGTKLRALLERFPAVKAKLREIQVKHATHAAMLLTGKR